MPSSIHMNGLSDVAAQSGMPMSHAFVRLESHGFVRERDLMQQASSVLTATSHALTELSKQFGTMPDGIHMQASLPSVPKAASNVDIVDVTDSVGEGKVSESNEELPFPVMDLPFDMH